MKISFALIITFFFTGLLNAQHKESATDTLKIENESNFNAQIDLLNRYIWRGQSYGGNYLTIQPIIEYAINEKWSLGAWATTNFRRSYYEKDDLNPRSYQEFDIGISYSLNDFISFELWDYYYPSVEKFEDEDTGFFNFSENGVQTLDAVLVLDFSEIWLPLDVTISTLVAGNDYNYNENDEDPKQNFTTYIEFNYYLEGVIADIEVNPFAGAVLNNKAGYYEYADYDKISFINLGVTLAKEFNLKNNFSLPITLKYIHNAATDNTEIVGRNFLVAGLSIVYNSSFAPRKH